MKYCTECGRENPSDAALCCYCGKRMSAKIITSFVELTDGELRALSHKSESVFSHEPTPSPKPAPAAKTAPPVKTLDISEEDKVKLYAPKTTAEESKNKSSKEDTPPGFGDFLLGAAIIMALAFGGILLADKFDLSFDAPTAMRNAVIGAGILSVVLCELTAKLGQTVKGLVDLSFAGLMIMALGVCGIGLVLVIIITVGKAIWNFFASG